MIATMHIKDKGRRIINDIQEKQILHLLHIGKTGGSAVKNAIRRHSIDSRYVIHLHPHRIRLLDVPTGEKVIFFLRDPINRVVSGFYSRQRQGLPLYFVPWSKYEKLAFEEFSTINQLALALSSTDTEKKKKAQLAMKHIRHVRDSYWNWFGSVDYFKSRLPDIFFVGFQECLYEDFSALRLKIGLPESADLPSDDVQAHRNPKYVDRSLVDKAVANLRCWLKDDYQFVALCKQLIDCKIHDLS